MHIVEGGESHAYPVTIRSREGAQGTDAPRAGLAARTVRSRFMRCVHARVGKGRRTATARTRRKARSSIVPVAAS